jgi:hypothetical protein
MAAFDPALFGARLVGGIELIRQCLNHGLEQSAGRPEDQFPERPLESQQLLLGGMLI